MADVRKKVEFYTRPIDKTKIPNLDTRIIASRFYLGEPQCFTIVPTEKKLIKDWGVGCYGTNASFYMKQEGRGGYMTALHIKDSKSIGDAVNNGAMVEGGDKNVIHKGKPESAMDLIYYTGTSVGVKARIPEWTSTKNSGIPKIKWGVGGFNLLLDNAKMTNWDTFEKEFSNYYSAIGLANIPYKNKVPRTVIGYRKKDNRILLAALIGLRKNAIYDDSAYDYMGGTTGATYYDAHLIMKYFGCDFALALDGSNCTKVSYSNQPGADKKLNYKYNGDARETWCRIQLTPEGFNDCNWACT